jgi:hypothetical protein
MSVRNRRTKSLKRSTHKYTHAVLVGAISVAAREEALDAKICTQLNALAALSSGKGTRGLRPLIGATHNKNVNCRRRHWNKIYKLLVCVHMRHEDLFRLAVLIMYLFSDVLMSE